MTGREFDIVIYGATGFVGKLTAEYLAKAGGRARIALAGRSPAKLEEVRATLGDSAQAWPILTADASSQSSLDAMAARTRVVVTTVGPYSKYGLPLVAACANAGTDYADLTGEAMFVRRSIDDFHKQAVDTGARIVHACGFDSIPSDMSVYELFRRAQQDGAGELCDTNYVLRDFAGGVSGGTIASMIEVFRATSGDPDTRKLLEDPYTLSQDRGAEPEFGPQPDLPWRRGREIAPELAGVWAAGFVMAMYNTRIVRRSNALLDYSYGRRFRYAEYMGFGPSLTDDMTVTTPVFEGQLRTMQEHGHTVIPLRELLAALADSRAALPAGAVVLTLDDGHRTVYTDLFPLIVRHRIPVTLFIYPTAISNASYALTWEQLIEMKASGLVDVQSHTFWHPNFNVERRRLAAPDYERFVQDQFVKSKAILEQRLSGKVDLLAWPFGIYDDQLIQWAQAAGYVAAFTIDRRPVTRTDKLMALPRSIVVDADRGVRFESLLAGGR